MSKLYLIQNQGCDDETCGLALIPDEHLPAFKEFIENLNKNSTYCCQPKIYVYEITFDDLRPATDDDNECDRLYLGGDVLALKKGLYAYHHKPIIGG